MDTSILSLDKFPGLEDFNFANQLLYETLQNRFNTKSSNAQLSVKAIISTEEHMEYFELPSQTPLLNIQGKVFDENGNMIEQVDVVYNNEADFNFVTNI